MRIYSSGEVSEYLRFPTQHVTVNTVACITGVGRSISPSGNSECHHAVGTVAGETAAKSKCPKTRPPWEGFASGSNRLRIACRMIAIGRGMPHCVRHSTTCQQTTPLDPSPLCGLMGETLDRKPENRPGRLTSGNMPWQRRSGHKQ